MAEESSSSRRKRSAGSDCSGTNSDTKRRRGAVEKRERQEVFCNTLVCYCGVNSNSYIAQIIQELLLTSRSAVETMMEVPTESDIIPDAVQYDKAKFCSVSVQTCSSRRSVRTQVSPKR